MRFYDPVNGTLIETDDPAKYLRQGFLPSVTTILSVIHNPWLQDWTIRQVLDHYCTTGDYNGALEFEDNSSAEFGAMCHVLVKSYLTGTPIEVPHNERHREAVGPLFDWLDRYVAEVIFCERSFADKELGYGGTADLLVRTKRGPSLLCDMKCKKNSAFYPMAPCLAYKYQLSAYRYHFEKEFGPIRIANLLLASPYGYNPKPKLAVCDYGIDDWMESFRAAQRLWLEQVGDE